jgi:hypothetical protein
MAAAESGGRRIGVAAAAAALAARHLARLATWHDSALSRGAAAQREII